MLKINFKSQVADLLKIFIPVGEINHINVKWEINHINVKN